MQLEGFGQSTRDDVTLKVHSTQVKHEIAVFVFVDCYKMHFVQVQYAIISTR